MPPKIQTKQRNCKTKQCYQNATHIPTQQKNIAILKKITNLSSFKTIEYCAQKRNCTTHNKKLTEIQQEEVLTDLK
jgi:hypothetical protein